jgi:hypothetical protein
VRERFHRCLAAGVRAPALHFILLGGLLFVATARTSGSVPAEPRAPIVITAARVAEIRDDYRHTIQAEPTEADLAALVDREAEEQMLYREALLLGLDRGDRTVEWRVVEKMHFLFGDAAGDKAEAYRRGRELGLARDDVMVRNALVTKMRLLAKAASRAEEPEGAALDGALEEYYRDHRDAYAQPERVTLTHVFVSADRHGDALETDARSLRRRLEESQTTPEAAPRLGDAFLSGHTFRSVAPITLVRTFGDEFTTAALASEPGRWSEPIRSPYGLHLVWIGDRQVGAAPPFEAVRSRVLRTFRVERHEQYLARMLAELRQAYEVRVEDRLASR